MMKRLVLTLALTVGLALAFLPACCVQARGIDAAALAVSTKEAATAVAKHLVFRQTNASVGPWTPGIPGAEYDNARRQTAAFVRSHFRRQAKMTTFEVASTPKPLSDVYRAFEAYFSQNTGEILAKDEMDQTLVVIYLDQDHAYLILAIHNEATGGSVVSIADLERQDLENES
jgi:hypothetical protein